MRGVRGVVAALVVAAVLGVGCKTATAQSGSDVKRILLFSGVDLWRHGGFAHGGALLAPAGLDNGGLVFKLMFGGGTYQYRSGALGDATVTGRQLSASVMPGWRWREGALIVTAFAGLDIQDHKLTPDDPSAGLRGLHYGARGTLEVWYEPTPHSMISGDVSVSTIGLSTSGRLAAGWRVFDSFYIGPEVGGFANDNYWQVRAGAHVTSFKTGPVEWSAGIGWTDDSDGRGGAYGRLGLLTRL